MPRILISEDDKVTSNHWRRLVTDFLAIEENVARESIQVDQAFNFRSTLEFLEDYDYDLVLLDHQLEASTKTLTGLSVLDRLEKKNEGVNILSSKFLVLTGYDDSSVARDYERYGCLEQLIKPIEKPQFKVAMIRAWTKLRLGEEESDWEEAYNLLSGMGLIQSLESLQRDIENAAGLQQLYDELKQQVSGKLPKEQLASFEAARKALASGAGSAGSILPYLEGYDVTEGFLRDVNQAFHKDRLAFWILQAYLKRFQQQEGRVRNLHIGPTGHAEYRIGRSYRLYFREAEGRKILEHFGHKNVQQTIIDNLKGPLPSVVRDPRDFLH